MSALLLNSNIVETVETCVYEIYLRIWTVCDTTVVEVLEHCHVKSPGL